MISYDKKTFDETNSAIDKVPNKITEAKDWFLRNPYILNIKLSICFYICHDFTMYSDESMAQLPT